MNTPWTAFKYKAFAVMWSARVVSNIGGWMYSASAVQVATTLPMLLFAVPAGRSLWTNDVSPMWLLLFTFLISVFGTLTSPEWQAVTPSLLPKAASG